ncbi:MAG: peptidylprolyl isomerase [Desulfuromonadaceae bacterium]|nr:peptidylprolyl isomerase [Desulfuromonadaceae bacterium]MDD2847537.1 peptidylprolyl isomerase [Desulfuromonadaceae bacterium]MDD4131350.1 peptidylprolyl isomerase [Desulfuromonadaceae bacterium]
MQNFHSSRWLFHVFLVAAVLSCSTLAGAAGADADKKAKPAAPAVVAQPKGAVARVNGIAIDAIELRRAEKVMLRGQPMPAGQEAAIDKQAVEQLVSAELLYQAAAKQEVKDLEKEVDAKLAQGKARFKDEQAFVKAIKDLDMDEKDFREYTRRDLLIAHFVEAEFVAKTVVSDAEIRAFYDKNQDKFKQDEAVKASHILIGVDEKASADEKKKALEKAEKLHKELAGGADFAALAKANSTCPSSQQGGDLGFFGKGQMVPEFEKAAFALKPGELSDVVETKFGYHIIKLTEKKPAGIVDLKDVKGKIAEYLKGQKINEAIQKYIADARKSAKIEILLK